MRLMPCAVAAVLLFSLWAQPSLFVQQSMAASAAAPATTGALVERFVAGQHYQVLSAPVQTRNAQKIEVVEMFSYGCSHCYEFEGAVSSWRVRLPADVEFRAVPVLFNPQFRALAQGFYAAQALKVADKSHVAMFKALHAESRPSGSKPDRR